jgi:hypothetical protein
MVHNKAFSLINISGLALGMACSLLIMLWVKDERGVDSFHDNKSDLYQVYERWFYDGKVEGSYSTQGLLATELKQQVPEIKYASGLEYVSPPGTQTTLQAGEKIHKLDGRFADADFFSMFSYPVLAGSTATALNEPGSIAISRKLAELFFTNVENALGKSIRCEDKEDLKVTAVFEDLPSNSSQQFDFLRSWSDFVKQNQWVNNWGNTSPETFVQLQPVADPVKVQARIRDFIYRFKQKDPGNLTELHLQPFSERYLHSTFKNGYLDGGRIEYVRLFSIVAVFILMIACINFMNLATARSSKRSREVGIRKVVGALRSALIGQFIGEALLLTFFAILLALSITAIFLPFFRRANRKTSHPSIRAALLLGLIVCLAGCHRLRCRELSCLLPLWP